MTLLTFLLATNAALHAIIIGRFGIKGNEPPALFGILYAVLAIVTYSEWAHAIIATLIVTTVGLVGLGLNFKKLQHDTTIEKIIIVVGIVILASAGTLLLGK
ncbi:MAG: hypothetical protein OEW58_11160 [Gammaproteobacteria bacterium]|nr:hypothetical protein [Gammaproteobacteria bacterium]